MNPLYVDTSALVPILVDEPGTPLCRRLWAEAERLAVGRLAEVELVAALAQADRMARLPDPLREVVDAARALLAQATTVEVTPEIAHRASELAVTHGLRGYDATHLATARTLRGPTTAFASGDRRLLAAAQAEGLTTIAT